MLITFSYNHQINQICEVFGHSSTSTAQAETFRRAMTEAGACQQTIYSHIVIDGPVTPGSTKCNCISPYLEIRNYNYGCTLGWSVIIYKITEKARSEQWTDVNCGCDTGKIFPSCQVHMWCIGLHILTTDSSADPSFKFYTRGLC